MDGEDASPSFVIKKRHKTASHKRSSNVTPESAEAEDAASGGVVMSKLKAKMTPSGRVLPKSRLSFGGEAEPEATPKRSFLKQSSSLAAMDTLDTEPTVSRYDTQALAELKAATPSKNSPAYSGLTHSKFGNDLSRYEESADHGDARIPTTNAIAAAKMKRDLARKMGVEAETDDNGFISLDVGHANKSGESRFVREEDELGSGDEELADFTGANDRIALGSKARKRKDLDRKAGMQELIDDVEEEHAEQDQEAMEWEVAQLKRGARFVEPDAGQTAAYKPAPIPEVAAIPTMATVTSRLQGALTELQTSHASNEAIVASSKQEVQDLDQQETDLRTEVERVSRKMEWFDALRSWVEDVAAFLEAKQPKLEKIERDNEAIQKERLDIIARRRFQDDADDVALFTGATITAEYDSLGAEAGAQEDEDTLRSKAPDSHSRQSRRSARALRRTLSAHSSAEDGYGTDDELPPEDSQDLLLALARLQGSAETIFEDVGSDEFKDPEVGILPRFKEWRALHEEEYSKSYGGLVMVNVWEFWARAEMLGWNPFQIPQLPARVGGFEGYRWHQLLSDYAHHQMSGSGNQEENVVAALVADVIVPRFKALMPAYDVYSSAATTKALAVVEEITYCIDRTGHKYEGMIQAVLKQIAAALAKAQTLVLPHLDAIASPLHALDINAIMARHRFALRLTKLVTCALRWRRLAKGVSFPMGIGQGSSLDLVLAVEAVEKCLLPILEAGWHTGEQEVAERVLSLFAKCTEPIPERVVRRLQAA